MAKEIYIETGKCMPLAPGATVLQYMWASASEALTYGTEETQSALSVLTDLISKMSSRPGTRTIVLVSPGFILTSDHRYFENQILDNAIRAKVVINGLDIRGVYTPLRARPFDAEYGGKSATAGPIAHERDKADQDELFEAGNVLAELAYGTGGAVRTDNDFVDELKQLAARPEYIYVLGFSPDNLKYDGSYHRLKVKLKETGYEVEARRGYWAPSRAGSASEAAREELKESFFSRDEISDIPLGVSASFSRAENGKSEIDVIARLDARTLKFRKAADRNNDTLTVVTGIFDRNGNYISGVERVIDMRLRDSSLDVLDNSGISVGQSFSVAPGQYIVRVVVKDREGDLTAARNTGIEIP